MTFTAPVLSYPLLSPMLFLLVGALIGVLVEAFVSKAARPAVQLTVTLGALLLALMQLWQIRGEQSLTAAMGSIVFDGPAALLQAAIVIIAMISVFLIADCGIRDALIATLFDGRPLTPPPIGFTGISPEVLLIRRFFFSILLIWSSIFIWIFWLN